MVSIEIAIKTLRDMNKKDGLGLYVADSLEMGARALEKMNELKDINTCIKYDFESSYLQLLREYKKLAEENNQLKQALVNVALKIDSVNKGCDPQENTWDDFKKRNGIKTS